LIDTDTDTGYRNGWSDAGAIITIARSLPQLVTDQRLRHISLDDADEPKPKPTVTDRTSP